MKTFFAVAFLLMLSFPAVFCAYQQQPLQLTTTTVGLQNPVEQQTQGGATQPDTNLWVVNNTAYAWDYDDQVYGNNFGYLDAGATASVTRYVIADWISHILGMSAYSNDNGAAFRLQITATDGVGTSVTVTSAPPVLTGSGRFASMWAQVALFSFFYPQNSLKLSPIPNSGFGGIGRVLTVTYRITNTGSKRIKVTVPNHGVHPYFYMNNWCPEGNPFSIGHSVSGDPSYAWCQAALVERN
jgi:hypothetical protein